MKWEEKKKHVYEVRFECHFGEKHKRENSYYIKPLLTNLFASHTWKCYICSAIILHNTCRLDIHYQDLLCLSWTDWRVIKPKVSISFFSEYELAIAAAANI